MKMTKAVKTGVEYDIIRCTKCGSQGRVKPGARKRVNGCPSCDNDRFAYVATIRDMRSVQDQRSPVPPVLGKNVFVVRGSLGTTQG
jgi:ssDNA-binding Zn-finger/Zn-ribbon topoisomerase 1